MNKQTAATATSTTSTTSPTPNSPPSHSAATPTTCELPDNSDHAIFTPASSSSNYTPHLLSTPPSNHFPTPLDLNDLLRRNTNIDGMDTTRDDREGRATAVDNVNTQQVEPGTSNLELSKDALAPEKNTIPQQQSQLLKKKKKQGICRRHSKKKDKCRSAKKAGNKGKEESSDDNSSSSSDENTESDSSDSSESESEDEKEKKKRRKKLTKRRKAKAKAKKKKSKKYESSSDESDSSSSESSDSESDSEEEIKRKRKKSKKAKKKVVEESSSEEQETQDDDNNATEEDYDTQLTNLTSQIAQLQVQTAQLAQKKSAAEQQNSGSESSSPNRKRKSKKQKKKKPGKRGSTLEYKRVDQLWDNNIHNYKLTESAEDQTDEFSEYIFTVRRKFDWENKYLRTVVDIKSKLLRDGLQQVMKDVKGVSLVEDQPSIDPNMLFLYLEEIRMHYRKTLKAQIKKERKKKQKKKLKQQVAHLKLLASYINEDYEETKKTLFPMLKAGNITFDLLWALFKPNTIAYTPTYGSESEPRCFKVDYANKESSWMRGEWYCIEGRYLEYDGKQFGLGDFEVDVDSFKGPRKITSLTTYPLEYHKDPEGLKEQLVERGKKFVSLQGMNYRFMKGLAFQKKKKSVAKVNINGRVMVDPAIFRRVNANYPISYIKRKDDEDPFDQDGSDEECSQCCGGGSDSEAEAPLDGEGPLNFDESEERTRMKVIVDKDEKVHFVQVPVDEDGVELYRENIDSIEQKEGSQTHQFTQEELLIASPVVLGFSFSDKLWLEFSLSGINEIEWNDKAFSTLVLPGRHKSVVKSMVSSHKLHPAQTIDDVVQGKGKGLVFVLHGPPGVGKTLTAEGIAEYLRCPLYAVSAGELGTDSRMLEAELNKIMDIAHSWGAVLLLDEADVFLERREVHDIHRNALVSIFLRLLEYFQGILFLTTNRVETFDEAFQSRIHVALKYEQLKASARKDIWRNFIEKVENVEGMKCEKFNEKDFIELSKKELNGRQIKNTVRTAQSISLAEESPFSMQHIRHVLEVTEDFDTDLRGGYGYRDAMKQYT